MPGPARAGAIVYAKDVERVARFYETLLPMKRLNATPERIVLESSDFQLLVHAMPPGVGDKVEISSPPQRRDLPVKLFFSVPSLDAARATAKQLGGEVMTEEWPGPGFRVSNARDCEGNVFMLREFQP